MHISNSSVERDLLNYLHLSLHFFYIKGHSLSVEVLSSMSATVANPLRIDVSFTSPPSSAPNSASNAPPAKKKVNTKLYKTNLCRTFSKTGSCPYGGKCQFAHGEEELRPIPPELDDMKKIADAVALAASSPMVVSSLYAGANHPDVVTPRVESQSIDTGLSPRDRMAFSLSSPRVLEAAASLLQPSRFSLGFSLKNNGLASPSSFSIGPSAGQSPRVALLNIGNSLADVSTTAFEKPIPEGARVDCDPKLYKTELCRTFSRDGVCKYGAKCQFAHGIAELRPAPHGASKILKIKTPELSAALSPNGIISVPSIVSPLVLDMDDDNNNHEENIETVDASVLSFSADGEVKINESQTPKVLKSSTPRTLGSRSVVKDARVYKTELCEKFQENGDCPYGLKCQFAHGEKELRQRGNVSVRSAEELSPEQKAQDDVNEELVESTKKSSDLRSYKTELCRSFNRTGYCRYGLKCQFAHGIQELRPSSRIVNAAMKVGVVKIGVAHLVSDDDTRYTPSSPRNLSGSPVIGSSIQSTVLPLALDDDSPRGIRILPIDQAFYSATVNNAASLPKASPTAIQVFSFPAPLNPGLIEDVAKRTGTPKSV